jgi:predicted kinase
MLQPPPKAGLVRACHGDLHLRNICLFDGAPTLFDAVEFNEDISCIDVLYDVAFLLMDLWHRGLAVHANVVLNEYLERTHDLDGLPLLPLFLSCRAGVRAKTSAAAARVQPVREGAAALQDAARRYLQLARELLTPPAACLIAIGGLSGSGKSTLARRIAPAIGAAPGAVIVRSDVIRKEILGVAPTTRLGSEGYTPEVSSRVYRLAAQRGAAALAAGHAVIADAVFARPGDRAAIAGVAADAGVPFVGIWLEGSVPLLAQRLRDRRADASDATPAVLAGQVSAALGPIDWTRLDGSADIESVVRLAHAVIRRPA